MPFVTLESIKPFVSQSMYYALGKEAGDGKTNFEHVEAQASEYVSSIIGIAPPDNPADTPKWIIYPFAMIIQKFGKYLISEISPEYAEQIERDFLNAEKILEERPVQDLPDRSNFIIDKPEGLNQW